MIKKGIKNFADVRKVINEYYKNPSKILNEVKDIIPIENTPLQNEQTPEIEKKEEPKVENEQPKIEEVKEETKPEEKKEPPKEDITSIFGFKIIAER
jgi:regulator of replication initiation timing